MPQVAHPARRPLAPSRLMQLAAHGIARPARRVGRLLRGRLARSIIAFESYKQQCS
jgi:hypothetical protein